MNDCRSQSGAEDRRAEIISELCPPTTLAYSFLLREPSHRLALGDLFQLICNFPHVEGACSPSLLPPEACFFDDASLTLKRPIANYVLFTLSDLTSLLEDDRFTISNGFVSLSNPPEPDIEKTLFVLRHIWPNESEFERKACHYDFVSYFHYFRLFDESVYCPELHPNIFAGTFDPKPCPEEALIQLFCHKRTKKLHIQDYFSLQSSIVLHIADQPDVMIGAVIGDILSVVMNSQIFRLDGQEIRLHPPYAWKGEPFRPRSKYRYIAGESVPHSSIATSDDSGYCDVAVSVPKMPSVTSDEFRPHFKNFTNRLSMRSDQSFTRQELIEYLLVNMPRQESAIVFAESNNVKEAVEKWIEFHAQVCRAAQLTAKRRKMLEARAKKISELRTANHREHVEVLQSIEKSYPWITDAQEYAARIVSAARGDDEIFTVKWDELDDL